MQPANIAAVIVAAGKSSRMGTPKQLLPWRHSTVIETVVATLEDAMVSPIVCVLGRESKQIAARLASTSVHITENVNYEKTEMLESLQLGLTFLLQRSDSTAIHGAFLSLGDQPHIQRQTIRSIALQIDSTPHKIVIPSYNMRRGHPFYIPRILWDDVLALGNDGTLRQILNKQNDLITYVNCESDEILWDIDTPEEYEALHQRWAEGC